METLLSLAKLWGDSDDINVQILTCQAVFVKKISDTGFTDIISFKGGMTLYQISEGNRGFTQDIDMDLISYSVSEESVRELFNKVNESKILTNIKLSIEGDIKTLNHPNYQGKRVLVAFTDNQSTSFIASFDIGVHNPKCSEESIYSDFKIGIDGKETIRFKIDPIEQMISEKLLSFRDPGRIINRMKDAYDCCALSQNDKLDYPVLFKCFERIAIFRGEFNSAKEACDVMLKTLNSEAFRNALSKPRDKWKDTIRDKEIIPVIKHLLKRILDYFCTHR